MKNITETDNIINTNNLINICITYDQAQMICELCGENIEDKEYNWEIGELLDRVIDNAYCEKMYD